MIPRELRDRPQWVVWRREQRDGKETKVPYRADKPSVRADATRPETWSSFETATAVPDVDGLGFTFAADDPFTGVDLDACIDNNTGELHPAAAEIIGQLDSYTERSPSGTGIHVIVRGELRGERNRTGNTPWGGVFEVYDHGRYFTMMNNGTGALADRQEQLDAIVAEMFPPPAPKPPRPANGHVSVDDAELLRTAFAAKNGSRLEGLYRGDTSMHDGDDSAADLALCSMLGFWTGDDPDRIDRLFRGSRLFRPKWERRDYRERTIETALRGRTEFYDWEKRAKPSANGAGPEVSRKYAPRWEEGKGGKRLYKVAELPPADDLAGNLEWLTLSLGLNPAHPIVSGHRFGTHDPDGTADLKRAGASDLRFAPFTRLCTPSKLLETLNACMDPDDGVAPPLTGEHIPLILAAVRRVCDATQEVSEQDRIGGIVRTFLASAENAGMFDTYKTTSGQRYELAEALQPALDGYGRPTGRRRYATDVNTNELVIRVSDLSAAAREREGSSLRRGELDRLLPKHGWVRISIDGHQLPGRAGLKGPHLKVAAYRGTLLSDDEPNPDDGR